MPPIPPPLVVRRAGGAAALALALGLGLGLVPWLAWNASAASNPAPRIVQATMLDRDGDDHADAVRLTWSEKVLHRADSDGHYPLAVIGYKVTKVGAAKRSTSMLVTLKEHAGPDISAAPPVTYSRTTKSPVVDLTGKQAAGRTFAATVPLDRDADGYAVGDCAPSDPTTSPGAVDHPDLAFTDTNCDGVDGDASSSIFVSPTGDDNAAGTREAPLQTLAAALQAPGEADILLSSGTYSADIPESPYAAHSVFGDYVADTWQRDAAAHTLVSLDAGALSLSGDRVLQLVEVSSNAPRTAPYFAAVRATGGSLLVEATTLTVGLDDRGSQGGVGHTHVGIAALGSSLTVVGSTLQVGRGGTGALGQTGASGAAGLSGGNGQPGSCDGDIFAAGGTPGSSPAGRPGGAGGAGGAPAQNQAPAGANGAGGTAGGQGGLAGDPGTRGSDGAAGAPGTPGAAGTSSPGGFTHDGYAAGTATSGQSGQPGAGGGGGGGGGAQVGFWVNDGTGNGGGGGGGGGAGGGGGTAGGSGGASIAIYAVDVPVTITDSAITTGNGGTGGDGGGGGTGGDGGTGGVGAGWCTDEVGPGANGGPGGHGGAGGQGGAGAGGASVGVVGYGQLADVTQSGVTWSIGTGGTSPGGAGLAGQSETVIRLP